MCDAVKENHEKFLERLEFYKNFGFDQAEEVKFVLKKALPIKGNILEIGTGKGHFALELACQGYNFTSIDISAESQELAKLNAEYANVANQVNFSIANAEALDFEDYSFDVIFSVNTIHHLSNPYKVASEMMRVISRKGKIILSDLSEQGFAIMNKIHQSEGRHHEESLITLNEVRDYLNRRGFWIKKYTSKNQDVVIATRG